MHGTNCKGFLNSSYSRSRTCTRLKFSGDIIKFSYLYEVKIKPLLIGRDFFCAPKTIIKIQDCTLFHVFHLGSGTQMMGELMEQMVASTIVGQTSISTMSIRSVVA